jgi:hypothetical protein
LSKFRIYRADLADPSLIAKRNKKLYIAYMVMFFLLLFAVNVSTEIHGHKKLLFIYYITLGGLILSNSLIILKMKRQMKKLREIGTLEFTQTTLKKELGDLRITYPFSEIQKMEINRYIRDLSIYNGKTGALAYILKITHKDDSEDSFIVSDKSIDFRKKISLADTIRILRSNARLNASIAED